jgi:hypothetical protein
LDDAVLAVKDEATNYCLAIVRPPIQFREVWIRVPDGKK